MSMFGAPDYSSQIRDMLSNAGALANYERTLDPSSRSIQDAGMKATGLSRPEWLLWRNYGEAPEGRTTSELEDLYRPLAEAQRPKSGGLVGNIFDKAIVPAVENTIAPVGRYAQENPAALFLAPLAVGAISGALSGAGAGSMFGGGGGAAGTIGPNGLPTGAMSASGGGVGTLSGSVPAVGASPGFAGLLPGASVGPNGLPTGPMNASGGGVGTMSGGVPAVGASPGVGGGFLSKLGKMFNKAGEFAQGVNGFTGMMGPQPVGNLSFTSQPQQAQAPNNEFMKLLAASLGSRGGVNRGRRNNYGR